MSQPPPPWLSDPRWFFPFFVLMWIGVTGLLAILGGWAGLAAYFRAEAPIEGAPFRFVSGSMGIRFFPVSYGNCLFVTVSDAGFRLSILFLFRILSPPLFIPWKAVASVTEKHFLFFPYTVVELREHWPRISIRGSAGQRIQQEYARAGGSNVP